MEVVGAVAATTQLLAGALRIVEAIIQLREYLRHAPSQLQRWQAELAVLESAINFIRDQPKLQTSSIALVIEIITHKIEDLTHLCPRSVPNPRSAKYLIDIFSARAAQSRILQNFADLDRDKVTLILTIQTICAPTMGNHPDQDEKMLPEVPHSPPSPSAEMGQLVLSRGPATDPPSHDRPPGSSHPSQGPSAPNPPPSKARQNPTTHEGHVTITNIDLHGDYSLFGATGNHRVVTLDNVKIKGDGRIDGNHGEAVALDWIARTPRPQGPLPQNPFPQQGHNGSAACTNRNRGPEPMDIDP